MISTEPEPPPPPPPEEDPKDPDDPKDPEGSEKRTPRAEEWRYDFDIQRSSSVEALQSYFLNGGGTCYIYAQANAENLQESLASLSESIEQRSEITLIVCPEIDQGYRNTVYQAVTGLLDKGGYFLIADSDDGQKPSGINAKSAQSAIYYPMFESNFQGYSLPGDGAVTITGYKDSSNNKAGTLEELKKVNENLAKRIATELADFNKATPIIIPASAAVAGVYCFTDRERGVWKAPANVVLNGVSKLLDRVDDDKQGEMNKKGINVIRSFKDRGSVVWGARTQLGESGDINWRYIPVRRLFNAVERDISQSMRFAVFEPNTQPTWERVYSAIDNYLYSLWQKGALLGNSAKEAYFIQIGKDITMTEEDIAQGKMIVKIGMAAVRPAEFIILQFTQDVAQ